MLFSKKALYIAALSALATFSYAGSAHAINFQVTTGTTGLNGETDKGAFSEFSKLPGTTTIDFNSGSIPTTGMAKYSFLNNSGASSVRADMWAPAGANGEVNNSNYLAVFQGDSVKITLAKTMNYFGIDWGAISGGNVFSFFKGDTLIKSFTTEDVNPVAPIRAEQHYGEGNGYLHFYSEGSDDVFDNIIISQQGGGGFESDNHSFHQGTDKFDPKSTPEPGVVLGMLAVGGVFVLKRKNRKSVNLG